MTMRFGKITLAVILTLSMNAVAIYIRYRLRNK